jgi:hypothetical protein
MPVVHKILALADLAKAGSFLSSVGWFETYRLGRAIDRSGTPVPWFTYGALRFLEPRVKPEFRVFEYGSGQSTIWWSERVGFLVSVEHDRAWHRAMQARLPARVQYLLHDAGPDGEYARSVERFPGGFHIVVIDGSDRVECARRARKALLPEGVVVWDNSDRGEYAEGMDWLLGEGFRRLDFEGMGPVNPKGWCTSVFYRDSNCLEI